MASEPAGADLVVLAGELVTMGPDRAVLTDAGIAIADGVITAIGPASEVRATHPEATVLDARDHVVTPGFVDGHQHLTADPLTRSSIPDHLHSHESIYDWIVPIHAAHSGDDDELSAICAAVAALSAGVTTVCEPGTVAHPVRVAAGLDRVGIRGVVATWGWDVEGGPYAGSVDEVLERQRALVAALPADPTRRVTSWVSLVGHDLASDELWSGAADLARELGTGFTFHMSPTTDDGERYRERSGRPPLVHLHDLDVLGPNVAIGHAVHLDDAELELILATDTAVVSCPWAYLRLAQGLTGGGRHHELVARGARLAVGSDAQNAADGIDALAAAATLVAVARDQLRDPLVAGGTDVLELATIGGAAALGLDHVVGSIEVGKRADLVVHDTDDVRWLPRGDDVALELAWGVGAATVRDVVVDGRVVLADRRPTFVDLDELRPLATAARRALLDRAGIEPGRRWPRHPAR
ncbi:MAG: amidohydrolase family protein [Acidimicrobiales bacterium]|nr:amidohydrolase family protein [Acidimicrobiales bacterium]